MALTIGTSCPEISGTTRWLNTIDTNIAPDFSAPGPILVYFWAMSCPACKTTMPDLQALRDKYAPFGLKTIAVHSPRGASDIDAVAVAKMAGELGMTEPCAIDDESVLRDQFQIGAWPTYFVFGANHKLKVRGGRIRRQDVRIGFAKRLRRK